MNQIRQPGFRWMSAPSAKPAFINTEEKILHVSVEKKFHSLLRWEPLLKQGPYGQRCVLWFDDVIVWYLSSIYWKRLIFTDCHEIVMDRPMDRPSYRDARMPLKICSALFMTFPRFHLLKTSIFPVFYESVTDRPTDRPTDGPTDRPTDRHTRL